MNAQFTTEARMLYLEFVDLVYPTKKLWHFQRRKLKAKNLLNNRENDELSTLKNADEHWWHICEKANLAFLNPGHQKAKSINSLKTFAILCLVFTLTNCFCKLEWTETKSKSQLWVCQMQGQWLSQKVSIYFAAILKRYKNNFWTKWEISN